MLGSPAKKAVLCLKIFNIIYIYFNYLVLEVT
jgi:hypothetical protein